MPFRSINYTDLQSLLNLNTLEHRREKAGLVMFFKFVNNINLLIFMFQIELQEILGSSTQIITQ